jgi:hypothetical protein
MLAIVKRSMLFREPVAVVTDAATFAVRESKKPWEIRLTVAMAPQELPDFLAGEPAFQQAVKAGAIIVLNPKLAA